MKKTILTLALGAACGLSAASAQDTTDIKHNTLHVDRLYAGLYGVGSFDSTTIHDGQVSSFGNVRVGGAAHWDIRDNFLAKTLIAYDHTVGAKERLISLFGVAYKPCDGTTIEAGKLPTAATHMVGSPVTPGGHFLFTAEAQVPGPGATLKLTQTMGDLTLAGSATQTSGGIKPSVFGSLKNDMIGTLTGASIYDPASKEFAGGIGWNKEFANKGSIFALLRANPHTFAYSAMYTNQYGVSIFADGLYDIEHDRIPNTQVGVLKSVNGRVNAKLGAGFDPFTKTLNGIVFVNIAQ